MINIKKTVVSIVLCLFLVGCTFMPKKHDPILAGSFVDLSISLEDASCEDQFSIEETIYIAKWMEKYAMFREDPQLKTVTSIIKNLEKASYTSEAACERWLHITNIKMKTLKKVWSKR